ncbi:MAG: hypothetical protein HYV96_13430 [Opitutae bacterium]|nr:hypothetical protein [Opitutae bacterium]
MLRDFARVKAAAAIIAEIKALPPEGLAEVSAFMLEVERADPALQIALERKEQSSTGQVVSRPYEQASAAVRAALNAAR